jgi:PAS domain S-box-containing protein
MQTREPASISLSVPPSDTSFAHEPERPAAESPAIQERHAGTASGGAAPLVVHCDAEQRVLSLGAGTEAWLELPGATAAGLPLAAVLGEVAHRALQPCITESLRGAIAAADLVLPHRDDAARAVHATCLPEPGAGGTVRGFFMLLQDTTERSAALATALDREARYRDLFESASDILYTLDLAGRITDFNREGERLTGYRREELIGRPVTRIVAPEHLDRLQPNLLSKLDGQATTTYELDVLRKDGERRTVEVKSRFIEVNGHAIGIQGSARDITERVALQALLERYRLLVEHTSDIVLFVRADGRIAEANGSAVAAYGYDHDALCSLTVHDLRDPGLLGELAAQLEAATAAGHRFETAHRRRDGTAFPVEVNAASADIGGERLIVSIIRDISARKAAERALAASRDELSAVLERQLALNAELLETAAARDAALDQANAALQEKDAFLGAVSHDLRTPLTAIRGYAQLLARRAARSATLENAAVQAIARDIARATARVGRLVDDLLSLSRDESYGTPERDLEPLDLLMVAQQAVFDQQQLYPRHRLRVECTLAELRGRWEQSSLERVLANVLGNALKYSQEETDVATTLSVTDDGMAVIEVADRGVGIPADELEHVFERFFRGSNVRGRVTGTGIGLAAVQQLVQRMGGAIAVHSTLGTGTTVTIRLPRADRVTVETGS